MTRTKESPAWSGALRSDTAAKGGRCMTVSLNFYNRYRAGNSLVTSRQLPVLVCQVNTAIFATGQRTDSPQIRSGNGVEIPFRPVQRGRNRLR